MVQTVSTETQIKLEAVNAYWGKEHCRSVVFAADSSGDKSGDYYDLNATDLEGNQTLFYVLYTGDTPPVDPAPAGKTKIDVTFSDDDTAATLATLTAAAIDALDNFNAAVDAADLTKVIITNADMGLIAEEINTFAPDFTFAVLVDGIGGNLGASAQGGVTVNLETQSVELVSDQTGSLTLGEIYTGSTVTADMDLIELTLERFETIVGTVTGDTFTPSGGTRLVGYGQSRLYQNLFALGGKLVLHPIRLPIADRSNDVVFWRSAPKPASISYSGQDIQALSVSFVAYLDNSINSKINLYSQGDWKQDVNA